MMGSSIKKTLKITKTEKKHRKQNRNIENISEWEGGKKNLPENGGVSQKKAFRLMAFSADT